MMHKEAALILCILYTSVRKEESPGGDQAIRKQQVEISVSHAEILERWTV